MNSYRNPLATWIGGVPSSNEDTGRIDTDGTQHSMQWVSSQDPSFIVLHTMVGHIDAATSRFQNPSAQVSATYGVRLDGVIEQWLDEKDAPYAEGNWEYNLNSIAIEHEDNSVGGVYAGGYTDAQYLASAKLVRDICTRYGIPINRTYIIKHKEVPGASTACPDLLDSDRIVTTAASGPIVVPPADVAPVDGVLVTGIVYDTATNDRSYRNWADLSFRTGEVASVGDKVVWTNAKYVNGKWFNRVADGRCLEDDVIDDGGFDPPHFRPVAPVIPPVDDDSAFALKADLEAAVSRITSLETEMTHVVSTLRGI